MQPSQFLPSRLIKICKAAPKTTHITHAACKKTSPRLRRQLPPQPDESPWSPPETAPPRFEFRFFCSVFRSEFKAPKTPLSHGLTGFGAIKPVAKKSIFQPAARRSAFQRLRRSANASPCSQIAAAKQRRSVCRGGAALKFAPGALFPGANPSPKKRPHRTVSGALLLST